MLVTRFFDESTQPVGPPDYHNIEWLAQKYAITYLPAATSLRDGRARAKPATEPKAFVGFGDPALEGSQEEGFAVASSSEGMGGNARAFISNAMQHIATSASQLYYHTIRPAFSFRSHTEEADTIKKLPRLPETAAELLAIGETFGKDHEVYLGAAGTETRVKSMELKAYRVIAFSTHAVPPGNFGVYEPALVLTPPEQGTVQDDGLLTASEIARLDLNADWVLLLACNTADSEILGNQSTLSSLARAFFYAGARSLLVSHWSIDSKATTALVTTMFDILKKEPSRGRSDALRCAMERVRNDKNNPHFAHPAFWAPFVIIGDTGRGTYGTPCPAL